MKSKFARRMDTPLPLRGLSLKDTDQHGTKTFAKLGEMVPVYQSKKYAIVVCKEKSKR
jgi:hypothetical protein